MSTLELRLDANGFVIPGQRVVGAVESIGTAAKGVEKKIQNFGTNAAFAFSSFATSAAKDFTSVLRSASSLAFAFGPTIGVVALSVSSIADAFATTREQSKSEMGKMLDDLESFEREFGRKARRIRISALEARVEQLQSQMNAPASAAATPLGAFGKMFRQGIGKLFGDANAPAEPQQAEIQAINERIAALRLLDVEAGRDKAFEDWAKDNAAALKEFNDQFDRTDKHAAFVKEMESKFSAADIARGEAAADYRFGKAQTEIGQIVGGIQHVGMYGLNQLGQHAGAFGGMISGIGNNLLMGNPWGAAAAGITGFIDGLLGSSAAAKQAREAQKALQRQYEDFTDSVKLELGQISQTDAGINAINRQFQEQRDAILESIVHGAPNKMGQRAEEAMKKIDTLNRLERELIEKRKAEADELERLNTAYRNAPTGFFVERYLQRAGVAQYTGRAARPPRAAGWGGDSGGSVTVVVQGASFSINGNRSGPDMVDEFVGELRKRAAATVGPTARLSEALDYLN